MADPAPALYAINDFYEELRTFAGESSECGALGTARPTLRSIESSMAMVHLVHVLSELTGRPGPFGPDETQFQGFDPPRVRAEAREALINSLIDEWDYSEPLARWQAHEEQATWQGLARYHICIFSNFLTSPDQVRSLSEELVNVFRALKPRGIVIVVGGTGAHYPVVYD